MSWEEKLPAIDRKALVLVRLYEEARQKNGQFGYKVVREWNSQVLNSVQFKQGLTVTKWLKSNDVELSWSDTFLSGFINYAFKALNPHIPHIGQLKNKKLLREFLRSLPEQESAPQRDVESLEGLYSRVIRPELRQRASVLSHLNLRNISLTKT